MCVCVIIKLASSCVASVEYIFQTVLVLCITSDLTIGNEPNGKTHLHVIKCIRTNLSSQYLAFCHIQIELCLERHNSEAWA